MIKETLKILVESIVDEPDKVVITEKQDDKLTTYQISVAENDIGRILGKEGKMAKSIRTIIRSIAAKNKQRVTVDFIENRGK